jgi:twitching motility two-component system response regulator PilH
MTHVLIVDDSPTVVEHVSHVLIQNGFKTSSATTAEQGIVRVRNERPDLILMDIVFPGMSGLQATRKINRDPDIADIPVVILSVRNEASDREWGLRQGAREYLTKPCGAQELIDAVKRNVGPIS